LSSKFWSLLAVVLCAMAVWAQETPSAGTMPAMQPASASIPSRLQYPPAPTGNVTDTYFGTTVADPYRWLEDDNSPQTKAWVQAENKITFAYLDTIPERPAIKARMTELWNFERFGPPHVEGGRYFFWRNSGLQNQSVWYVMDKLKGEPRELLDPNKLSSDGTVALTSESWTEDGRLMAYGLATAGSDWQEWRVMDTTTGKDLRDVLKWVKFSGASWTKDGKGLFYSRYDEPKTVTMLTGANYFQKLYFHKLGTPQSEDVLVYNRPDDKTLLFGGQVTDDGAYLAIDVRKGTEVKNRFYYKDLGKADAPVVKLLDQMDAQYDFINNIGPVFYFETNLEAPRGRVIAIDIRHPERAKWKTVVAESRDSIDGVSMLDGDKLVVRYLHDAHALVSMFDIQGKHLRDLELPGIGSVNGFQGKRTDTETFYTFTGFTTPPTVYRYDFKTEKSEIFRQPKVAFNPADYETKQVFYTSKDGTRVPMFLTYKKGIKLDGQNPTLLYAYGGFDIPITPTFSAANLVWMEMGGIYAVANLRGGGEYGEEWHQAGMKLHKQNVFDDFIAAAEWLIANHYTSTPKLAVIGRSNGGLLIGAVETQRPDLFGVCLPGVGVMDMLRFNKFTIGWAWVSDYGSAEDSPEMFKALYAYSPYHNIRPGVKYPPTLVVTADHDDRVVPGHSFKFTARMQADQAGTAPILIRIETRAGHGGGKPTDKIINEYADEWGFLVKNLHMEIDLPGGGQEQTTGAAK
jgi:prolyl oligopeptidase